MTRFNKSNAGVQQHKEGDIFEYEYVKTVDKTDENDSHALFVIEFHEKNEGIGVTGCDIKMSKMDALKVMNALGSALKLEPADYKALGMLATIEGDPILGMLHDMLSSSGSPFGVERERELPILRTSLSMHCSESFSVTDSQLILVA